MRYSILILLVALFMSCNNSEAARNDYEVTEGVNNLDLYDGLMLANGKSFGFQQNAVSLEKQENFKVIKESYLAFETDNLDKTFSEIVSIIKKYEGYIQDDSSNKNYNRTTRRLIIRIPTVNFQNTIDSVSAKVAYFDSKQITLKDVTEEFIDLEARLKAKQELEKRYLELLKKAKNVSELLEIERELSHIREEIEAKQGRLKYLQNKVSLSTINIEFYKITSESKVTKSYGSKMWSAIVSGFDGMSSFFLGILNIWPLVIVLSIAFLFVRKWVLKRKKK